MVLRIQKGALFRLICLLLFICIPLLAGAGSHPYTKHEIVSGVGLFDMVVSLDWNPTQADKDGRLKTAFEQFAEDLFMMSEGKNKIRRLYVFTGSSQMSNADIRFLDKGGRSNATINGIFNKGKRILTYTGFSSGKARTAAHIGHTIAHEFGHYVYGVYDEYRGKKATEKSITKPVSGDSPKGTIMATHGKYQWLSLPSDYEDDDEDDDDRQTAQWRVFNSSAWETIVRDPKNDKLPEQFKLSNPRVRYGEFENAKVPATLNKPSDGWDSSFQIIYMKESLTVLVINTRGSAGSPGTAATRSAAKQFVDLMSTGDSLAVVLFDASASTLVDATPLTGQAAKDAMKAKIDTISAGEGADYGAGLARAWSILNAPAFSDAGRTVVFLSDSSCNRGTCPPNLKHFTDSSIPIYTVGLGDQTIKEQLSPLSTGTGGAYYGSSSAKDLVNLYAGVSRQVSSQEAEVVNEESETLTAGQTGELPVLLTGKESMVTFRASWEPGDRVTYELVNPSGTTIGPGSLPVGVTYLSDDEYAMYTVSAPAQGTWIGRTTATAVTATGSVSQQATSQSQMVMDVQLTGGVHPDPIGIMVSLDGPEPVAGATVIATVTPPAGGSPIPPILLRDDEEGPDSAAGDGIYSGTLADYRANGTYTVTVVATNPSGNAYLSTEGSLESDDDSPIEVLPPFRIMATATVTVSGYDPALSTPTSAIIIPTDNGRTWGAIRNDGDVLWYRFAATADTRYFIQTGDLLSTDGNPMATLVTLYEPDGVTEIASSSHYRGSSISFMEWVAPASGTYFITVEHASPGTGSFSLTTGTTSLLADAPSGGSGSSRCFVATAAFGSGLHPYVGILRLFRDRVFLTSFAGRLFVEWYYRVSPPIADAVRGNRFLRALVQAGLLPAIGFGYLSLRFGTIPVLLACLLLSAIIYGVLSRRRRTWSSGASKEERLSR